MNGGAPLERAALRQRRMLHALARRLHGSLMETHISWVLLAGAQACKFKKVLRNSWLDYGDPATRRRCCEEELRLNRRLAPQLYLGLAEVGGHWRAPQFGGQPVLDYAVRMRRFDQRALWSWRLAQRQLTAGEVGRFGAVLADFHAAAARAPAGSPWGHAAAIGARTGADLDEVRALLAPASPAHATLDALADWLARQQARLSGRFARRLAAGWVRECHGDLHCGNVLTLADRVLAFDGVEFNPGLRWIDVQQDLAFLCMDLQCHGRDDLAARLLDAYLQRGGDYDGLALLPYYRCQRALVRAKVALLAGRHMPDGGRAGAAEAGRYLDWALRAAKPAPAVLLATHGRSGSGKSTLCDSLVEPLAGVRVRSDVERKRLHGLAEDQRAAAGPGAGIYTAVADKQAYARLLRLACGAAAAGLPVLLDAAFLQRWQRRRLFTLARRLHAGCLLLATATDDVSLFARLAARDGEPPQASDAGVELVAHQRRTLQSLQADEQAQALFVDTSGRWSAVEAEALAARIRARLIQRRETPHADANIGHSHPRF
ncbi:hypothetical protein RugamoR64_49730 [Duganella rhizosphaerae]|uniref:bifunctional aminoglycoside phosphotransferase/ATP-binding protein n=1 Tax=Duganella rhizosphaerae TaxID=2885763 RepID=UPI0030E89B77